MVTGYGLRPKLDNLMWIHENLAFGTTVVRWADSQAIVYERPGPPGLLVGLNNDPGGGWRTITLQTSFGAGTRLHDYTGRAGDVWTDANGLATIGIPPNDNGSGYVAYSRYGQGRPFSAVRSAVTQELHGAADLDIAPIADTAIVAGRIWCEKATAVLVALSATGKNLAAPASVLLELTGPDLTVVGSQRWTVAKNPQPLQVRTAATGWHSIRLTGTGLPAANPISYIVKVTYTAPQTFGAS